MDRHPGSCRCDACEWERDLDDRRHNRGAAPPAIADPAAWLSRCRSAPGAPYNDTAAPDRRRPEKKSSLPV